MPSLAEMFSLALRHHQSGQLAMAEPLYRKILQGDPTHANALHLLGLLAHQAGRREEAIPLINQAIALCPKADVFAFNLGLIYKELEQWPEAVDCFQKAWRNNPNHGEAQNNLGIALNQLGNLLQEQGRREEAIACYRQVLTMNPHHADVLNNLGNALQENGQLDEAVACYQQAVRTDPNHVSAHNHLGSAFKDQGFLDQAARCYQQALELNPHHKMTLFNRSLLRLLEGDFDKGWPDYELRWQLPGMGARSFPQPRWDGSPLEGRTILIHAEQGLGDTLQFLRYLPMVQGRGGKVVFECQPALLELVSGLPGVTQLIGTGTPLPPFDMHAPIMSLPGLFGTTMATIPADCPYLEAKLEDLGHWRDELSDMEGFKVGIIWQGNPAFKGDRLRSIPLKYFERLAHVPGVHLVCLQKAPGNDPLHPWAGAAPPHDLSDKLKTFRDTAAAMKNLDLVISSCTATAHLAGALAVPTWTVLQLIPDWRWLLHRTDSPWYPTMCLFRQKKWGDWGEVFQTIEAALRQEVTKGECEKTEHAI